MGKKDKTDKQVNFLDFCPNRCIEWEKDEQGRVFLLKEKFSNPMLKKLVDLFRKSQFFRIHLDEIGTFAWVQADGKRTVGEIAHLARNKFAEKVEPAEQRVAQFFKIMEKNGFIKNTVPG